MSEYPEPPPVGDVPPQIALPDRLPPQSIDAEQSTLGAALISRSAVEAVLSILKEEDFYLAAHQTIYLAIADLHEKGRPVDLLSVPETLRAMGMLERVGGTSYLSTLENSVPTAAHVEFYARIVKDKSVKRQLIHACGDIIATCYEGDVETPELLGRAEQSIFAIGSHAVAGEMNPAGEVMITTLEQLQQDVDARIGEVPLSGVDTGFSALNRMTGGWQKGDLIIVGGRTSMGKTAEALAHIVGAAKAGTTVGVFSLEMTNQQLARRMIASEARIDGQRIQLSMVRQDDWTRIGRAVGHLGDLPIWFDDTSSLNPLEIAAKCRRLKQRHNLGLVVIDYLQLVDTPGRHGNRNEAVGWVSRMLKRLARELDVPVIALAQVGRGAEGRREHRPLLSDLRESGSIEQDADVVIFVHRPAYYLRQEHRDDEEEQAGEEVLEEAEFDVAKHRNGPVGLVKVGFLRRYARFEDLAEGYREEPGEADAAASAPGVWMPSGGGDLPAYRDYADGGDLADEDL